MSDDLGRYQRMADRAAARKLARTDRERAEWERKKAGGMEGEDPPNETPGPHYGHRSHVHGAHPGAVMCSCGQVVGGYSYVVRDEDLPLPERCPVCDAHAATRGTQDR